MFEPKGFVIVDKEIKHTKPPPEKILGCDYNLKEEYFNAMQGKMLKVVDVAVDGSDYLVQAEGKKAGVFLWMVDKRDTIGEMIPYSVMRPLLKPMPFRDLMKAAGMDADAFSDENIERMSKAVGVDLKKILDMLEVDL
ncbi:MAG: hypothetical protein PHO67_07840 [Candidatus Omnitrophica bacterium]|nr:hypothetical protein [Candidatus Omnitrophota bacterium]